MRWLSRELRHHCNKLDATGNSTEKSSFMPAQVPCCAIAHPKSAFGIAFIELSENQQGKGFDGWLPANDQQNEN